MTQNKLVSEADLMRLEDAIRNLWMSHNDNNKRTYDRICSWINSLESAPEVSSIVCPNCNKALPSESAGMRRKFDHVVTNGEPV